MKFILEVELGDFGDDVGKELGRILRYWGGAMRQVELTDGTSQAIYDSAYREVGQWRVTASQE